MLDMVIGHVVVDNTTAGKGLLADPGFEKLQNEVHRFVHDKLTIETPVSWIHFRKVLQLRTLRRGSQSYSSMKCTALLNSAMYLVMKFLALFYSTMILESSCSILKLKALSR